ncbi:MAG: hypothetical protein GXX96_21760 [Planctomycetaceae bacterium]|nr:hypothetical protein [Planctomycetaceae bacterium]
MGRQVASDGDLLELLLVHFSARGLVLFGDAVGASAAAVQHVAHVAADSLSTRGANTGLGGVARIGVADVVRVPGGVFVVG